MPVVPCRTFDFLHRKQVGSRAALICKNFFKRAGAADVARSLVPLLEGAAPSSMWPKPRYVRAVLSARLQTIGSFAWNLEPSYRCSDVERSRSQLLPTHSWSPLQKSRPSARPVRLSHRPRRHLLDNSGVRVELTGRSLSGQDLAYSASLTAVPLRQHSLLALGRSDTTRSTAATKKFQ